MADDWAGPERRRDASGGVAIRVDDAGRVIDLTAFGRRKTDRQPERSLQQADPARLQQDMRALLIELLEHEDRGYGPWTSGMRNRVIGALNPGVLNPHQLDRRWESA